MAGAAACMIGVAIHDRGSSSERRLLPGGPRGRGFLVRPRRRKPMGRPWAPELTVVLAGNGQQGPTRYRQPPQALSGRFLASSLQGKKRA